MKTNMLIPFYRKGIVSTLLLLAVALSYQVAAQEPGMEGTTQTLLLVDNTWLREHLDDPNIVIVDARLLAEYEKGHIVGAINLPAIRTYHSDLDKRVVLQQEIEEILGNLGIKKNAHVIVYGSAMYEHPARVFWTMDVYGHTELSLLNGGYPAWQAAGLPVDTRLPVITPVKYHAVINPGKLATRLQTLLAIENPQIAMIDARGTAAFQGAKSSVSRYGHIPTAIHIAKGRNLELRQGISYFKSEPALEKLYADVSSHLKTILYCDDGAGSAIGYLSLRLLDKDVSIYDGSWREWGSIPGLPIESPNP